MRACRACGWNMSCKPWRSAVVSLQIAAAVVCSKLAIVAIATLQDSMQEGSNEPACIPLTHPSYRLNRSPELALTRVDDPTTTSSTMTDQQKAKLASSPSISSPPQQARPNGSLIALGYRHLSHLINKRGQMAFAANGGGITLTCNQEMEGVAERTLQRCQCNPKWCSPER